MNRLLRTAATAALAAIALQLACSPEARAQCGLYGLAGGYQDFHDPALVTGWSGGNGITPGSTWEVDTSDQTYHRIFGAGTPATYYGTGNAWADYDFSCKFSFPKRCSLYDEDFSTQASVTGWSGGNGVNPGDTWIVDAAQQAYHPITTGDSITRYLAGSAWKDLDVSCKVTLAELPLSGQTAKVALYGRYQANTNNANLALSVDSNGLTFATYSAPGGGFTPVPSAIPFQVVPNTEFTMHLKFVGRIPLAEITPSAGPLVSIPFTAADLLPLVVAQGPIALEFDPGASGLTPDKVLFDDICVDSVGGAVAQPSVGFYARYKDPVNCVKLLLKNGLATLQAGTATPVATAFPAFETTGSYGVTISVGGQSATATVNPPSSPQFSLTLPSIPSTVDQGGIGLEYDGGTGAPADGVAFDDVCVGGTIVPQWTACTINPNPVGWVEVGALKVTVTLDQDIAATDLNAVIVPQGVKDTETAKMIPLSIAKSAAGVYNCLNTIPITTFLGKRRAYAPADRTDTILDGHAHVNVTFKGNTINRTAAAEKGRHLLIDTIPPIVVITPMPGNEAPPPSIDRPLDAAPDTDLLVTMYNEAGGRMHFAANGINSPTHPYPMISSLDPNGTYKPDAAWQLDPEILARLSGSPYILTAEAPPKLNPTVLYNIGSVSNATGNVYWNSLPTGHDRLDIEVKITVLDQSVYEKYNLSTVSTIDADSSITDPVLQLVRQTAGPALCVADSPASWSDIVSGVATVPSDLLTGVSLPLPGAWMDAGLNVSGVTVSTDQAVANPGYFDSTTAPVPDMDLSRAKGATVHLRFVTAAGTGIPLPNAADFDFKGPLVGQDRVGNRSDATDIFDPYVQPNLHVQWNRGDDVISLTFVRGAGDGTIPSLTWEDSTLKKFPPYGPYPLYTFSAWKCTKAGEESKNLSYELLLDWKPWDLYGSVGPANFDPTTLDQLKDRYVLIVAAKMDAAGNVTPWDWDNLTLDLTTQKTITPTPQVGDVPSGRTWYRFLVPGESSLVDTALDVDFKYSNPTTDLGPATIIQYPRTADRIILGNFDIGVVTGLQTDLQNAFVVVELEQDGRVVFRDAVTAGGADMLSVSMPALLENPPNNSVELSKLNLSPVAPLNLSDLPMGTPPRFGRGDRVVNYVFRAYTVVQRDDGSGNWVLPPIVDTSPANFNFKVVPKSIENFLESSGGEQPIKIYERE